VRRRARPSSRQFELTTDHVGVPAAEYELQAEACYMVGHVGLNAPHSWMGLGLAARQGSAGILPAFRVPAPAAAERS
jgi:uncharacterized membrane protein